MQKNNTRHIIDLFFVISLFCVFAFSSLAMIGLGTGVYEKIVSAMDDNYEIRTSFAYLTEKVRQTNPNAVRIESGFGDSDALLLSQDIGGESYVTKIYLSDGKLKELFCKENAELSPIAGQDILGAADFTVSFLSDRLLHIQLTSTTGETTSIYCNLPEVLE